MKGYNMNDIPTAPVAAPAQPLDPKAGIEQNDRKYPRLGSTIRQIWDWLDAFMEARSTASSRAELLTNLEPAGFHPATLATQYAAWRRFHGIVGTVADPAKADKAAAKAAEKGAAVLKGLFAAQSQTGLKIINSRNKA